MPNAKLGLLIAALASLTGCASVASLHPLILPNDKDVVLVPALVGTWEDGDALGDGPKTTYTVAREDTGSGYSVHVVSGDGEMNGTVYLIQAGPRYLLDIYCSSDSSLLPAHFFASLRLEKKTAWVAGMDGNWLQDEIRNRGELRYEVLDEGAKRLVLTASPVELRRYLLPMAADERSFDDESELRRIQ